MSERDQAFERDLQKRQCWSQLVGQRRMWKVFQSVIIQPPTKKRNKFLELLKIP